MQTVVLAFPHQQRGGSSSQHPLVILPFVEKLSLYSRMKITVNQWFLTEGGIACSPEDIWPCRDTFLVVTLEDHATGIS